MHMLSRVALSLICMLIVFGTDVSARCQSLGLSLAEAERAFAGAELVFVGTLQSRTKQKPRSAQIRRSSSRDSSALACQESDDDDATELTTVTVTSGARPSPWVGQFALERFYKGVAPERLHVRVTEELVVGERYLVYAYGGDGVLDASQYCSGSAFAYNAELQEHLTYLDTLPAAGTGGFVDLRVTHHGNDSRQSLTLEFAGPQGDIQLRYDDTSGENDYLNRSALLPAGQYRLLSVAEHGFRYRCRSGGDSCDELLVQDQAVEFWGIDIEPLATVQVHLRDALGEPALVDAEFEFVDASNGQPIAFHRAQRWDDDGVGIAGRLVPSRVVPVLVLSPFDRHGKLDPVLPRQRIYSAGKTSWRLAEAVELSAGHNDIEFILPADRQPVMTRIDLSVAPVPESFVMGSFGLRVWIKDGDYGFTRQQTVSCHHVATEACSFEFLGIPGQFWALDFTGYHFARGDQVPGLSTHVVEIIGPQVLPLVLEGQAQSDALKQ